MNKRIGLSVTVLMTGSLLCIVPAEPVRASSGAEAAKEERQSSDRVTRVRGLFSRLFGKRPRDNQAADATEVEQEPAPVKSEPRAVPLSRASSLTTSKREALQSLLKNTVEVDTPVFTQPSTPSVAIRKVEAPATSYGTDREYIVQPGDSLRLIARLQYQDPAMWVRIREHNRLESDVLRVGQRLILPATGVATGVATAQVTARASAPEPENLENIRPEDLFPSDSYRFKIYKVGAGDTLSSIASREMGSARLAGSLGRFNDLSPNGYLVAGQSLVVPLRKQ